MDGHINLAKHRNYRSRAGIAGRDGTVWWTGTVRRLSGKQSNRGGEAEAVLWAGRLSGICSTGFGMKDDALMTCMKSHEILISP
jgi:hypothetical protein